MTRVQRVLDLVPVRTLDEYVTRHAGGAGLRAARAMSPEAVADLLAASGLRGRGGAGFPTGVKWRTVQENRSTALPATVVVNAAEGEPGTFKDRTILRNDPYQVLEGALIAAHAVGADQVVVATKGTFGPDIDRLRTALAEIEAAGWPNGIRSTLFEGPDEYLYGEETALLEVLDGRRPFPRIAPPFRRGITEVVESDDDVDTGSGLPARVEMGGPDTSELAPPALVDNVETLANVARILERGAEWFRTEGTVQSPGSIVVTITGHVRTPGVGEVRLGTTIREAIDEIAGGPDPGRTVRAVMPGVSSSIIPASMLDTPLTYEAMATIGSGLGSAGFWVLDDTVDPVAAVAGASRFLAIESCGQCSPCKLDGLALADLLARISRSEAGPADLTTLERRVRTVADGARCSLGRQQQDVVQGLLTHFRAEVDAHVAGTAPGVEPILVAELLDLRDSGVTIDLHHRDKQPDWTYDATWEGETPVERFTDHRASPVGLDG